MLLDVRCARVNHEICARGLRGRTLVRRTGTCDDSSAGGFGHFDGGETCPAGRAEYQRGTLRRDGAELVVSSTGNQSSNRLSSFQAANCLIEVPRDVDNLPAGAAVDVLPFGGLLDHTPAA